MKILFLNQCFYPDVVSTAQHVTDLAKYLARNGNEVTVLASARGYDEPAARYPKRERWNDVEIIRISQTGFGKRSRLRRGVDFATYLTRCALRLLFLPRYDVVVALTSPPLISFLASLFVQLKGGSYVFWVMDLNPDEAIAAGWLKEGSWPARILSRLLDHSLDRADRVIVLDRFMRDRVRAKGVPNEKVTVIPPWSHDGSIAYDKLGRNLFRAEHGLTGKYVVMYSGNHSPCHPLDTVLEAARELSDDTNICFCFVGGGSEMGKVKQFASSHRLENILCLPYQPLEHLSASLSAADLHLVVMGDPFVGLVHPCKIYNVLELGIPFLYVGPDQSHIVDIGSGLPAEHRAHLVRHGDVIGMVEWVRTAAGNGPRRRAHGSSIMADRFSSYRLMPAMARVLKSAASSEAYETEASELIA